MNTVALAKIIAKATRYNSTATQSIRDEYSSLALTIATDEAAGKEVTSATVNGQSFSQQTTMSKLERMKLLDAVIYFYDHGITSTTRTRAIF